VKVSECVEILRALPCELRGCRQGIWSVQPAYFQRTKDFALNLIKNQMVLARYNVAMSFCFTKKHLIALF